MTNKHFSGLFGSSSNSLSDASPSSLYRSITGLLSSSRALRILCLSLAVFLSVGQTWASMGFEDNNQGLKFWRVPAGGNGAEYQISHGRTNSAQDAGVVSSFYLKEYWCKLYQNEDNIWGDGNMYYWVYRTASGKGALSSTTVNKNYYNWNSWNGGWRYPTFGNNAQDVDLLSGLASGKYTFEYYFDATATSTLRCNNNGSNFTVIFTYNPIPAVSDFTASAATSASGTGLTSDSPFIIFYNQDVTLTVQATASPDANSKLQFSFDGTNWEDADANNKATTSIKSSKTSSNDTKTIYYRYYNSTDDLAGSVGSTTIYYRSAQYTITLNNNGGADGDKTSTTVKYGSTSLADTYSSTAVSKTGYALSGWYKESACINKIAGTQKTATLQTSTDYTDTNGKWTYTSNVTLYAGWTPQTYTVTLDKNGGSGGKSSVSATFDASMPDAGAVPTKTGYDFGGYYEGQNGTGTQYYDENNASVTYWDKAAATTIYAKWTPKTITVTLRNYNDAAASDPSSFMVTYGSALSSPVTCQSVRPGYTWRGYATTSGNSNSLVVDDSGNLMNNKSGYTEDGKWVKATDCTLYDSWVANVYTITLNNRGADTGHEGTASFTAKYGSQVFNGVTYSASTFTITPPSKTGYNFGGYCSNSDGTGTTVFLATGEIKKNASGYTSNADYPSWRYVGNTTLYAKWTAHQWTITLDDNEGSGGSGSKTATYGTTTSITSVTKPTRATYTFAGYYVGSDCTGPQVYDANGALVANATGYTDGSRNWIYDGAVTLYAKWISAGNYVVTLDNLSATTAGTTSVDVQLNTTKGLTANITVPSKTGYTFGGYFTATGGSGTKIINADGSWVIPATDYIDSDGKWLYNGNVTLKANWIANQTTITFDKQNGTGGTNQRTLSYNSSSFGAALEMPTRDGYTFGGYFTAAGGEGTQLISSEGAWIANVAGYTSNDNPVKWMKTTTDPMTIYAKWTPVQYAITYDNMAGATNFENAPATYTIETATINLGTPTKTGYTFGGWKVTNAEGAAITSIVLGSTGDKTVWATWSEDMNTITIVGGTAASATAGVATTGSATAAAAATGYTWSNWTVPGSNFTLKNCAATDQTITFNATAAGTVTANYTLNSHTLTWNLGGGSVQTAGTAAGSVDYGTALVAPVLTRTGYSFAGWSPAVAATMPDNDITYTATWTEDIHTITIVGGTPSSVEVGIATSASITASAKQDYTFTQWECSAGASVADATSATTTVNATADATVMATYTLNECKLKVVNGKKNGSDVSETAMSYDDEVKAYYIDVTTNANPYCYRFKVGSDQYCSDWKTKAGDDAYSSGKKIVLNDDKIDANISVGSWGDKPAMYFSGFNGSNVRIWFDYQNKQTWMTCSDNVDWYLYGSDELGNWIAEWSSGAFNLVDGVLTASVSLSADKDYQFKLYKKAGSNHYWSNSSHGKITDSTPSTVLVYSNDEYNTTMKTKAAGMYTFTLDLNNSQPGFNIVYPSEAAKSVTVSAGAHGSVDPEGTMDMFEFEGTTVTAAADDYYYFTGWTPSAGITAEGNPASVTASQAGTLQANFAERWVLRGSRETNSETLEGMPGWGTTSAVFTDNGAGAFTHTVTLLPNRQYKFMIYDKKESAQRGYQSENQILAADVQSGSMDGIYHLLMNSAGYGTYTFTLAENDLHTYPKITITNPVSYPVTMGVNGQGTVAAKTVETIDEVPTEFALTSGQYVRNNGSVTFTATPDAGYEVEGWYSDAECNSRIDAAGVLTEYTASNIAAATTVYVKFQETFYNVTIYVVGDGVVSQSGTIRIGTHTGYELTATPNLGARFSNWTCSNVTAASSTNATTTFTATADGSVTANFVTADMIYFKNTLGWSNVYIYTFSNDVWYNTKSGDKGPGVVPSENKIEQAQMMQVGNSEVYCYPLTSSAAFNCIAFSDYDMHDWNSFYEHKGVYRTDRNSDLNMFIPEREQEGTTTNNTLYCSTGVWMNYNATQSGYSIKGDFVGDEAWTTAHDLTTSQPGGYTFETEINMGSDETKNFKVYIGESAKYGVSGTMTSTNCTNWKLYADQGNVSITSTSSGTYIFRISLSDGEMRLSVEYPLATGDYRLVYTESEPALRIESQSFRHNASGTAESPVRDTISFFANKSKGTLQLEKCTDASVKPATWVAQGDPIALSGVTEVTDSRVNNFVIRQVGEAVSIETANTHLYTGNYYVRTDGMDGGWNNYRTHRDNQMGNSEYSLTHSTPAFNYYATKWISAGTNVEFTVANDYNKNLALHCTDDNILGTGVTTLPQNSNVRFMYNSQTNALCRAYLSGSSIASDRYLVVTGDAKLFDSTGKALTTEGGGKVKDLEDYELLLTDNSNWVYQVDAKALSGSAVKVTGKYNNQVQYFVGTAETSEAVITTNIVDDPTKYDIRLIYDFKTNLITAGWVPSGTIMNNVEVSKLLIQREGDNEATQFAISNEVSIVVLQQMTTEIKITKESWQNDWNSTTKTIFYWFSLPYTCRVGDISGIGTYNRKWQIQRYRGDLRAAGTAGSTPWRAMKTTATLEANRGYILALNLDENDFHSSIGETAIRIMFPSAGEVTLTSKPQTTLPSNVADGKPIQSNWFVMGVPVMKTGGEFEISGEGHTAFEYVYEWGFDPASRDRWYDPVAVNEVDFKSTHAYMVQAAGTLDWTYPVASPAPKRMLAESKSADERIRLNLVRNDETLDKTYVLYRENGSREYEIGLDFEKIKNEGRAMIYSSLDNQDLAALCVSSQETEDIPLTVVANEDGEYTFALQQAAQGNRQPAIYDVENATLTMLNTIGVTVSLAKGTYSGRFMLRMLQKQTPTDNETIENEDTRNTKFVRNGVLYILRDGQTYDAQGRMIK